jgi:hypothetical protein
MRPETPADRNYGEYKQKVLIEQLQQPEHQEAFEGNKRIVNLGKETPNLPEHQEKSAELGNEIVDRRRQIEALKKEIELLEEQERAIRHIPVLFDTPDFDTVLDGLRNLDAANVKEVKVGETVYSVPALRDLVGRIDAFSYQIRKDFQNVTDEEIDQFLAKNQVTRQKISPHSKLGFRESMSQAIRSDSRAVRVKFDKVKL